MSKLPPVPPQNRSPKGHETQEAGHASPNTAPDTQDHKHHNAAEQGETANIKQNTTNKGYFQGRRTK